jgi:putative membrane protein
VAGPAARATRRRPATRALVLAVAVGFCAVVDLAASASARADTGTGPTPGTLGDRIVPVAATAAGSTPPPVTNDAPLSAADKDLVVKVRLAGLWEMPAGQMAASKGANPRVREVGSMIGAQHARLDALVTKAAKELDVPLPDEPNADQQKWLGEMRAASGADFDRIFVDRLRAAHGKIFPAIGLVRSSTRNSVVRQLAQSSNGFVLTHLTLLESTGLVNYESLPTAPAPSAPSPSQSVKTGGSSVLSAAQSPHWYLWIVVPGAVGIAGWSIARTLQSRRRDRDDDLDDREYRGGRDRRPQRPAPSERYERPDRGGYRDDRDYDRGPRPPTPVPTSPRSASYQLRPHRPSPYTPQTPVRIPADERLRTTPRYRP